MKKANDALARRLTALIAAAFTLLLAGCATVPPRSWRPWLADAGDPERVSLETPVVIDVDLDVPYLPGSVAPLEEALADSAGELLSRRGYEVAGTNAGDSAAAAGAADVYRMELHLSGYRVERVSTQVDQASGSYTSSFSSSSASLGAYAATRASTSLFQAQSFGRTTVSSRTVSAYQYDLALEVRQGDDLVWQGRASWLSPSITPERDAAYALRLLASALPRDAEVVHQVPRVRESHYDTYYETTLDGRILRSPGIPYVMYIGDPTSTSDFGINWDRTMDPPWALAAYADAMENAEEALPTGDDDWSDPFDEFLWRSLRLGGRYRIGNSREVHHVIVDLAARPGGYVLERGAIVSAEEYEEFEEELGRWRERLEEWWDVFE
jgi:hypothetical protein